MNIEAILNDLEDAERALRDADEAVIKARLARSLLIREAAEAGVPQAVIGRLLGVSRQRIHQLMEV